MQESKKMHQAPEKNIVLIGTGPCVMIKAMFLAKENPENKITLIDAAKTTGGAWYTDISPGGYEIESGCHIWTYVPESYKFLENELALKLYDVYPHPVFVSKNLKIPYSVKNTLDTYKYCAKLFFTGKWKKFRDLKKEPNIQFRIFGKRNKYPSLGSVELISRLNDEIKKYPNINLRLNTVIQQIEIKSNKVSLTLNESEKADFDLMYLSYVSKLNRLIIQNEVKEVKSRKVNYIHFLFKLDKPLQKKISYWRMINDPIIHRITDISSQTDFKENLILIAVKEEAYHRQKEIELINQVILKLGQYKLIDSQTKTEHVRTNEFVTEYLSEENLIQLEQAGLHVKIMRTTDLMHGIYFLLSRREERKESQTEHHLTKTPTKMYFHLRGVR